MSWLNSERGDRALWVERIITDDKKSLKKILHKVGGKVSAKKREHLPRACSKKDSDKIGWLRRFLAWIAKGVEESHKSGTYCPT